MRKRGKIQVAYPAVLGAVSLVFLFGAAMVPTGMWGMVAVAGLGPCAVVASIGTSAGFWCWGGVSLLALLLLPDKFCALLFTLLFGLYPMLKALSERTRRVIAWILKLGFFNLSFTVLLFLMRALMLESLPSFLTEYGLPVLYLAANVVFCLYDIGLTKLICLYLVRIDRAVRKWTRRF